MKSADKKVHILIDDNGKTIRFKAEPMVRERHFHNNDLSVWTDYKVWKKSRGYVCTITKEAMTPDDIISEQKLYKLSNKKELVALLGLEKPAIAIYTKLKIQKPETLI